ncbi:MAG: leucine-rich repeat domain-containing protein [Muribaculaceae bacterium]|nr:leucine-rich repeat domain-containing protein [Muribaculaceae bacterium]
MIKKLLAIALLLTGFARASAKFDFTFRYDHDTFTCVVTGHTGTPDRPKVYIPLGIGYPGMTSNFKVVGVEPDALNDLIGVDTIVIPNTIEYIGHVSTRTSTNTKFADLRNFRNCPDLSYIQVTEGNKVFKSTGAGILTSADGRQVYRVPPKIDVSKNAGTLKMGAGGTYIAEHAFDGNTTIKSLVLSKNIEFLHMHCGIHLMPALEHLSYASGGTGEEVYMVDNDALIRKSDKRLMFYPPACPEETYIVTPINVTMIGEHAFANTTRLKELIVPEGPRTLGNYAFENSSVEKVTFPSTMDFVTGSGYGAFKNSKIQELKWSAKEKRCVPRDFMLDCKDLKTVCCDLPFHSIGSSAFRNCTSLENFSHFSGATYMGGDSIWANTGLKEVRFDEYQRETDSQSEAKALFAGCKRLKRIDMSDFLICTDRYTLNLWKSFAEGCDSLESVWLPGFVRLDPSCFAGCPNVNKLVMHKVEIDEGPIFTYNTNDFIMPMVYVMVPPNCAGCFDSPLEKLFANTGKGEICPQFHFEEQECWMPRYVQPSINYIPGHCEANFPKATKSTPVIPLFEFRREEAGDKVRFIFSTAPMTKITEVWFDLFPEYMDVEPKSNTIELDRKYWDTTAISIFYEVNGIPYTAGYAQNQLPWNLVSEGTQTGIDDITFEETIRFDGGKLHVGESAATEVYDLSGLLIVQAVGPVVDLSGLPKGIYVVVNGGKRMKIRI